MLKGTWNDTGAEYFFKLLSSSSMAYNTTVFFFFLAAFLGIYFLIRNRRMKRNWILVGNLVFYLWSGRAAMAIVAGTAVIVYITVRLMEKIYAGFEKEKAELSLKEQAKVLSRYKKRAKGCFLAALVLIGGVWVFVKTGKFLGLETVKSFEDALRQKGIIVPLGISYYSLSAIGYMLEVYWRRVKPEHNFLNLFAVMTYFPHIVQGPISRYDKLLEQLNQLPAFQYERVCQGLQLMLWGYLKKLVVADRLVIYTTAVFTAPNEFAGTEIFLAIMLCGVQLYADFDGCMDIVRGISQVLGIELEKNFRQPLFARSAQEFWARWHITLGAWTKDYIYLPIALNPKFVKLTNRLKKEGRKRLSMFLKAFCPLAAVWLFTGLWHGTGADYLVWGLYWCVLMTLSREGKTLLDKLSSALRLNRDRICYRLFETGRTYLLFAVGRTLTISGSLAGCALVWKRLFAQHRLWTLFDGSLYTHGLDQKDFYVALAGIAVMMTVDFLHERGVSVRRAIAGQKLPVRWFLYYSALFALLIFGMYGPGYDAASFVYGAF